MKTNTSKSITWILALLLSAFSSLSCFNLQAQDTTYTVGIVPQFEAKKLRAIWQPIINYLAQETGHQFSIEGSPSIPDFEDQFLRGEFDFAYMNPYHINLANEQKQYVPLVREVGKTLHGTLVVKADSSITRIAQLDGSIVAFPAPNALGASLLIRQEIRDNYGIKIFPRYVKTHDSVYLNVLLGEAAAGGGVEKTLNQQPAQYQQALRIIHTTQGVPPHPFAAHPRVPARVVEAVKAALLKLGSNAEGKALLEKIPISQIGPSSIEDYLPLKQLQLERFFVR
ncbi:MAG: phosphate/phosphite/phosphonate ABC transporter substrate-binding protein [Gammaproteobacteria bacterium]|nr:phosphate/phosphite/phosphonate ABC transporter substrate-binding protein [Gammaproteobacteria bacterium]